MASIQRKFGDCRTGLLPSCQRSFVTTASRAHALILGVICATFTGLAWVGVSSRQRSAGPSNLTEIPGAAQTGSYKHPVPLTVYVLEGVLTLEAGQKLQERPADDAESVPELLCLSCI